MEVLEFRLSGDHAFFKIPEVNSYKYMTYSVIHKPALLGIMGAMLGYDGYISQVEKDNADFPEYYKNLSELKISVQIESPCGVVKKEQKYNNSVGYASQERGNNLIVTEDWLENPSWKVRIIIDSGEAVKVRDTIIGNNCVFIPYLGKNDHPANITDAVVIQMDKVDTENQKISCETLFHTDAYDIYPVKRMYNFTEKLPEKLDINFNQHIRSFFTQTNGLLQKNGRDDNGVMMSHEDKYYYFY